MRTTIDMSDALFHAAKDLAHQRNTSLRSLVEEGLRLVLERTHKARSFALSDASFGGKGARAGLVEGLGEGDFAALLERAWEGRGA